MGKYIETKYSNVQNRVIKPAKKKRKVHPISEKISNLNNEEKNVKPIEEDIYQFRYRVKENTAHNIFYLSLLEKDDDLFCTDILKARYDQYTKYNFLFSIFDEIALEGLDGITIEGFWKRMNVALKGPTGLENIDELIWKCICLNKNICFFEIPEARENLNIYNTHANEVSGLDMISKKKSEIYKIECAPKGNIWGSCTTLQSRVDISNIVRNMSLAEAYNAYQNKLVIVANQTLRTNVLYHESADINYDIMPIEYCILEKIARSRTLGEITLGVAAIGIDFNMNSKSVHHYGKRLSKQNLITKQFFSHKTSLDQIKIGSVLHLRRFYVKNKSNLLLITETIIDYLKKCPKYRSDYTTFKKKFRNLIPLKYFKNSEVLKYMSPCNPILYREMYPNAIASQYMNKVMTKERIIRTIQLKNPYINVIANWSDTTYADSSEDEDENEDSGYLIGKGRSINMEFSKELYLMIRSKGLQGSSMREINDTFDVDFGTIRTCTKKLVKAGVVNIKRCDEGKQRHDQYIAKYFRTNEITSVKPYDRPQNISTVEKMKQRQKTKIKTLNKDQVYMQEQFEAECNLSIDKPSYLPVSMKVPSITCSYLNASLSTNKMEESVIKSHFSSLFTLYFRLNLTLPQLVDQIEFNISTLSNKTDKKHLDVRMEQENSITSDIIHIYKCKPDHLTKVFLMLAMLRDIEIKRKDIIDFLNLNNKKDKGIKRKYSKIVDIKSEIVGNNATSSEIASLCDYMGPNPILVSKEKGEYDVNIELIMSTPPEKFVTENITHYTFDINNDNITDRLLSRIKIILNEINTVHICKEIKYIVKIIRDKEKEEGYNKIIDKKSSQRIIRKLVTEGYIKVFQVHISNDNLKRMEVFICHPRVNHDNDVIKAQIQQTVWKHFGCGDRKIVLSKPVIKANDESKISPFGRKDVQASIRELKCLNQNKQITMKMISSSKSGKLYGYRPKFSRMSILHELLFYLIYELDTQAQALSKAETLSLFQSYQINLTHEDLEKLPPVFNKELSWKMFIPPLPHHQYWNHGWALICDVILRMPVSLITKVHCISYYSTELLDMLHHPIKRFYMLKNLSPQLHNVIMYRRKYIHSIYETIARLGYCGLVQFGPSKYQEKDQIFLYLNRRASLLETMDSEPAYHKVTVKNYNKVEFTFNTMDDILKYWSTLHTISMNTPLNSRYIMSGKTITLEKEKGKICLQKVFDVRTQEEAKNLDNGTIPGDHRGAAGLDSALWSHIKRNWFYFGKDYKNLKFTDDLESLKFDQVVKRERVSFEQLKVPSGSTKFFIPKSQVVGNLTKRNKLKGHRESRIIKRKMPIRKVSKSMKNVYDDVDKAIYKKYKGSMRFKPSWSGEEDKLLIILKIAAKFLSPKKPKLAINNTTLRDILHRVLPASLNKTTSAIPRRWKILKRDIPSIMNIDFWVSNLFKLDKIQQFFLPLRIFLQNEYNSTGKPFKLSDAELQNAFIFLCYYIITHRKEVETTLDGNMTTVDYFKSDNIEFIKSNLVSVYSSDTKYMDPVDKDGIRKSVLKKLFHSVLGGRKEDPAWSYQLYQVFQKFSDSSLKSVIAELKEQKMMTYKKDMIKKFHTPYKIGLQYIFSQCTIFNYNTVEEAYYTFSSVKSKALQFDRNYVEEKNYGQLIAVHEMTTVLWNNITLKFNIPENPFILNPDIVDHSELIEELAKRYQVKLKNEAKEVELSIHAENANKNTDLIISAEVFEQPETSQLDDDYEPLDLTVSADSETINNLKHWISDCIDTERVRSPSPDLLMFQDDNKIHMPIKEEVFDSENATVEDYRILSLDEIKKEMLRVTSKEEKRNVPYITDLTKLLTENFDEIETDELTIDRLKKHFVQQYPSLVTFEADASHNSITESIENKMKLNNLWQTFFNKQRIILPLQPTLIIEEILNKHGRNPADIDLINHIITFIDEKNVLGATGQELKNEFQKSDNINSLISIINTLLHYNIIIKVGICCIRFIHYTYASEWLLESFNLNDTHTVVQDDDGFDELRQQIDSNMKVTSWIKIKLQPWIKVDGTVNKDLVRLWLSTILSYCTENPKLSLRRLCNKFSFMAPVDIYHLLEVLEELGCLEIRRFLPSPVSLFSEFEISEDTKATFLDNFEDMFIDLKYMPFTSLGAFLHNV